ncbi:hypothetical protein CNR22_11405 [Sphingobacteriaceae bacterium]|nr:hypothetical protein CNR22_11405 [Sphingobacteriaceae bacterium]
MIGVYLLYHTTKKNFMSLSHWTYFLSIEQDVHKLSRYIEFSPDNYECYSIETARILMTATQEIDVILKQICAKYGDKAENEAGYRRFFRKKFPKLLKTEVDILKFEIGYVPFSEWKKDKTPDWWTGNNKVKHQRHTHYKHAKLENVLKAVSGLFLVNLYHSHETHGLVNIFPGPTLFGASSLTTHNKNTVMGLMPQYEIKL